jgi:heptaprenyl diphosphate synthase
VIDIASGAAELGKTPGTDLREGVITVPMLHALAAGGPDAERLRVILAGGPVTDATRHAEALDLLRRSPGLARARADVREYAGRARAQLVALPLVPAWFALESLCDFVIERTG